MTDSEAKNEAAMLRAEVARLQAELAQVRENESRLRTMIDASPALVSYVDAQQTYRVANETYREWFGMDPAQVVGRTITEIIGEAAMNAESEYIGKALRGERTVLEKRIEYLHGKTRDVTITLVPDVAPSGQVRGLVGIIYDVTELRQKERLVAEQRQSLISSAKLAALGEMSGSIAHEINNPLCIIQAGALQIKRVLKREAPAAAKAELISAADSIELTVMRISKIIRSLRSIARDGEHDAFERARVHTIVDEAIELCRERFRAHGVRLEVGAIDRELEIDCRSVQISQVILNLLNNAFDAVEQADRKEVRVEIKDLGAEIELRVVDSGTGVPERIREDIFLPFVTTKDVGRGTGLGLSVSRAFAQGHRGVLLLDAEGPQTCFRLRLPKRHAY